MAKIVFYPRRISYTFFDGLRHNERVEVSVPNDKIRFVNRHLVRIDSSVMKEIGIVDENATCKDDWSFWCYGMNSDVTGYHTAYPCEVDIIATRE